MSLRWQVGQAIANLIDNAIKYGRPPSAGAAPEVTVDLSSFVVDEITIVGSRCGPFAPALELLRRNAVEPRPLISATSPLAHGVEALDYAAQRGVLKVQLDMVAQGVQILEKGDAG